MKAVMLGLLAETAVHPGSGRNLGVVDLPVAREAATGYPVIVGSSLKGALRDKAEGMDMDRAKREFGEQDRGGRVLVSDGRLVLLPVRSLSGASRWVTCPQLIERYARDRIRCGHPLPEMGDLDVPRGRALATGFAEDGPLFLEERQFEVTGTPPELLVEALDRLVRHKHTRDRLAQRLVVLHDDDFAWFAAYGLPIQARNKLDDNKISKNLWHEEHLPPDTVMYTILLDRDSRPAGEDVPSWLFPDDDPYLQVGGNETVGQGWFVIQTLADSAQPMEVMA